MKFKSYLTSKKYDRPVIIVGLAPGRQRKDDQDGKVWRGNRSGDLMQKIISGRKNLYMTNVNNGYRPSERLDDEFFRGGLSDLIEDIKELQPRAIICCGNIPYKYVTEICGKKNIHHVKHPSYILRFNQDKAAYLKKFKELLDKLLGDEK